MRLQWFSYPSCICGARRGRLCFCDEMAAMRASWPVRNPGRIYACTFSDWVDASGNELVLRPEKLREFIMRMTLAKLEARLGKMNVLLTELKRRNALLFKWLVGSLCLLGFTCVLFVMSI